MAIQIGSVEVDVIPNTQGIYSRLNAALVPPATRVGDDMGRVIARRLEVRIAPAIRDAIEGGARAARPSASRQGDETGGAFSRALKTRLEAAFRSLPKIRIGADTSEADSDLQALRVRMETLAGKRIGIDIDAEAAKAEIRLIEAELQRLGAQHPNVQVRADTATAAAELAAVRAEIEAVDGKTARIDVDTSGAVSAVLHLAVAIGGLAAIPALPILAAGLGAVTAAAFTAAAGVGALAAVAAPAFIGIAGALQAQKAAQDAATTSSLRGSQAGSQAASRALQQAGAQQALAAATRNAASQIASARDQIRQAERGVEDAERQLADSQKASKQAQLDLVAARKEAAQQLEDLANQYADAQLSTKDAELSLAEAQARLAELQKDPKATELERQRAALAVEQATQRLKEQQLATRRLKDENAKAAKSGVNGTDTVKRAEERLAAARRLEADRARAVADAEERVAKARQNLARVQAQAADQIASAQRQIASASLQAAGGVDQAAIAQAKYQEALAKLTPSARSTLNAFLRLREAFKGWSTALQPAVMPLFTRALDGLRRSLPSLTPFVFAAARAIGILQDKVARGFKSPWWLSFKKDLAAAVVPATVGLGTAFGNVFKTIAGIVDAFLPHMDSIAARMERATGRWAKWATGLKGSPQFERFLAYSSKQGPVLAGALKDITRAVFELARASSPLSGPVLKALGAVASAIASIARNLPWLIQLMYGAWVATKLWTLAVIAFNLAMNANPIVRIIAIIVALVAAVVYAYKNWDWFRTIVDTTWRGIVTAAKWAWGFLQPIFSAIWTAMKFVGGIAAWLWQKAIGPAFRAIWEGAKILLRIVAYVCLAPLYVAFKVLGAIVMWLWDKIFKPALKWIAQTMTWLYYTVLKPIIDRWKDKLILLGRGFMYLWQYQVKPALEGVANKARWLYEYGVKPWFGKLQTLADALAYSFRKAKTDIGNSWDQLRELTRTPVSFIINAVYNSGIVPVWNAVAKVSGSKKLEPIRFATGGILPGYTPGRDVHLAALSGGEAIMRPEWTRAVGAGYVDTMNAAARGGGVAGVQQALGLPAFADGGIFGRIKAAARGVGSLLGGGAELLTNPTKMWSRLTGVISGAINSIASANPWSGAVAGTARQMIGDLGKSLADTIGNIGGGGGGSSGGSGVQRWSDVVLRALALTGQPPGYLGITLRRMNQESGGDPNIVNRWDSNWQAGHPSVGLMQVIGPTFDAYAGPFRNTGPKLYGVSVNPLANVYASMRYALSAYGSLPAAYNRAGGYDSGGYLQPGLNLAYNGTGRPEPVFTTRQANALVSLAASGGGGGLQAGQPVTLVVQDGPTLQAYVAGVAGGQVAAYDQAQTMRAVAGRRV